MSAPADLRAIVSDRPEDIDRVLRLVHDGFVEAGYLMPRPSGRRMIAPYLNPGTAFVLGRMEGRDVGASAFVPDGPFGLPSDRAFVEEIDEIRATGVPLAECGSLTVAPDARRHTRHVFSRLMGALVRLIGERGPDSTIVISVAPETARFYCALFGLEEAAEARPLYREPAVLLRTDYATMTQAFVERGGAHGRLLASLVLGPAGSWLRDRRQGLGWPLEWLEPLLDESGVLERLRGQMDALSALTEVADPLAELAWQAA
jgi:ribosomal protein S18 acetylase RimI-like enzyme